MKNTLLLLSLLMFFPWSLSSQSVKVADFENNNTDKLCDNRLERYTSGGTYVGALFETTANPQKESGYNSSSTVLKIYDVNYKGAIVLNVSRNLSNTSDQLDISSYNALKLKYHVPEGQYDKLNAVIKLNGAGDNIEGTWTNTGKNWKTVSFSFSKDENPSWIQLFLYYGADAWSADIMKDLAIYIDDIEFYYVEEEILPAGSLKNIRINGTPVEFFDSRQFSYTYYLPYDYPENEIPEVTYQKGNTIQTVVVSQAANLLGSEAERTAVLDVSENGMAKQYKVTFEILPKLDIFLCLGQSNMSGYGDILSQDKGIIQNTYLLTPEKRFEAAENPLNKYSTISNSTAKISPAYGFVKALIGKTDNPVGLLVNARNGSSIEDWAKGNTSTKLYDNTVARAKEAMKWGDIKGIIWHQGESNSGGPNGYKTNLTTLVANFRADLKVSDLYFVAGEIAYWRKNGTGSTAWNAMIRTISSFISNSDWVSAEGLSPWKDTSDPHFDRASAITLGERYAEKVLNKLYAESGLSDGKTEEKIRYELAGNLLTVFGLDDDTVFSVVDICGKTLFSKKSGTESISYTFPSKGMYLVLLNGKEKKITQKMVVK